MSKRILFTVLCLLFFCTSCKTEQIDTSTFLPIVFNQDSSIALAVGETTVLNFGFMDETSITSLNENPHTSIERFIGHISKIEFPDHPTVKVSKWSFNNGERYKNSQLAALSVTISCNSAADEVLDSIRLVDTYGRALEYPIGTIQIRFLDTVNPGFSLKSSTAATGKGREYTIEYQNDTPFVFSITQEDFKNHNTTAIEDVYFLLNSDETPVASPVSIQPNDTITLCCTVKGDPDKTIQTVAPIVPIREKTNVYLLAPPPCLFGTPLSEKLTEHYYLQWTTQ